MTWRALVAGLAAVPLFVLASHAHNRPISYSTWTVGDPVIAVTLHLSSLEASRLPIAALPEESRNSYLARYFLERLRLLADGVPCPPDKRPRPLEAPAGRIAFEWELRCPAAETLQIESTLFLDVAPSHLHFARVHLRAEELPLEKVLSEEESVWTVQAPSQSGDDPSTSFAEYAKLGVFHIWTGYDHLAFLAALLLLGGSLLDVARIVTGFTVAHSITLAVAVLGYLRPEQQPIEALIGLSIALVAAENLWLLGGRDRLVGTAIAAAIALLAAVAAGGYGDVPAQSLAGLALFTACYFGLVTRVARPAPLRAAIAFCFGLLHGFGFAGILMEIRLPTERLAPALFGFNLGVELGQLAVLFALWPLLKRIARIERPGGREAVLEVASASVLALGVFWFVSRTYG